MARRKTRKLAKGQGRWHYLLYGVKSTDRLSLQDHLVTEEARLMARPPLYLVPDTQHFSEPSASHFIAKITP